MSEKKYTVCELNALRRAVEHRWLYGRYTHSPDREFFMSRSYREEEKATVVEERVRTHMLAGHTAEDLYASEHQPSNNRDDA